MFLFLALTHSLSLLHTNFLNSFQIFSSTISLPPSPDGLPYWHGDTGFSQVELGYRIQWNADNQIILSHRSKVLAEFHADVLSTGAVSEDDGIGAGGVASAW
jgi:hypothetical protein